MGDIPEHLRRRPPPVGIGEMKSEVCEHWTTRHAPIEGKKNVHYCTICKSECTFPDWYYEKGSMLEPN